MDLVIYFDADLAAQRLVWVFGPLTSVLAGRRECTNVVIVRSSRLKPTVQLGGGGISSVLRTDCCAGSLSNLSIRLRSANFTLKLHLHKHICSCVLHRW
jgi:hypothetical protein